MKNPFKNFSTKNFKKNWEAARSDPYIAAKTNYKMTRFLVYGLMIVLGFTFVRLLFTVSGGSSVMTLAVRGALLIVGVMVLSKIYFTVLNPLKKVVDHYENDPRTITSKHIDAKAEIDEILAHFDNKEKTK